MARFVMRHNRLDMAHLATWLDQQEEVMAMPGKVAFAVRQCLEEAVANLIDHTPAVADEGIAINLDWEGEMLVATVEDQGPPFDLRTAPSMTRPTSLETVEPGGWGIPLIRSFATDIDYQTTRDRNRLTLRFAHPVNREAASMTSGIG